MSPRVAFFGPFGTFTEQALRSQADLVAGEVIAYRTVPDVLDAVSAGDVDFGFVPIENSIEGMVNFTLDALAFDHDLLIVREVVLDIHMCLAARPGIRIEDVHEILSIPVATAQCHRYLRERLPDAEIRTAVSTAGAAQMVSEDPSPHVAAIAPGSRPSGTASTCSPRTSKTTKGTRRASWSSPVPASQRRPATIAPRSWCTSGPTSPAA
jgi:prephenate dehydratase